MNQAVKQPRKLRALIVEDEAGDVRLMQVALKSSGFAIDWETVSDGTEALRFMRREGAEFARAPRPDLILLDLKMPGQSGLDFLAAIKRDARLRGIPAVVVTTSALDADVMASYQRGAVGYVTKPADVNEFIEAIRMLCQYWFKLVRLPWNHD